MFSNLLSSDEKEGTLYCPRTRTSSGQAVGVSSSQQWNGHRDGQHLEIPAVAATNAAGLSISRISWPCSCGPSRFLQLKALGKVSRMGVIGSFKEMLGKKWTGRGSCRVDFLAIAFYYQLSSVVHPLLLYAATGVLKPSRFKGTLGCFINNPLKARSSSSSPCS